jgi:alpha-tubulin suppressor-like RCC1 family protein
MKLAAALVVTVVLCGCGGAAVDESPERNSQALKEKTDTGGHCAAEVGVGNGFACARRTDGSVACWGLGQVGQLGDGRSGGLLISTTPVEVSTLGQDVAQLSVGYAHACARKTDGTLWCWGNGSSGELGNGLQGAGVLSATPIAVIALGNQVAEVSAGDTITCARKTDGTLWCWGYNLDGEVGAGFFSDDPSQPVGVATPTQVIGLPAAAAQVSAGGFHVCTTLVDHRSYCWGVDFLGELGDGRMGFVKSNTPIFVADLDSRVQSIAAGFDQTCAVQLDHTLWCWGGNIAGDLGLGTDTGFQLTPAQVTTLGHDVSSVAVGPQHSCAITRQGKLFCWGDIQSNRLYTLSGFEVESNVPVQVRDLHGRVLQVSVGFANTCAVTANHAVYCKGANQFGALGVGDTADHAGFTRVALPCPRGAGHGADDCDGDDD